MRRSVSQHWFVVVITALLLGCKQPSVNEHMSSNGTDIYTCPMHVEVQQNAPGKCPVCGMELVKKSLATFAGLMLNDSQVRLANITTRPVRIQEIGESLLVNARLTVDEERSEMVSTRIAGRVDKLFVKETGRTMRAGEPFLELYSESLLSYQQEYLLALDQARELGNKNPRYEAFARAAKQKLLRYGLTTQQVDELSRSHKMNDHITFLAPTAGVVRTISVIEGQYVEEGSPLYRLENIKHLWVEAELYPDEISQVVTGQRVIVRVAGWEDNPQEVPVTFVTPEYQGNTQVTLIRASLKNTDMHYQPGMQAQVVVRHSTRKALAVPVDAVIRGNQSDYVFVMTDKNTFERRNVTIGLEDFDQVEITSGLREGDQVVVTGAYLLHSEMILKGIGSETTHQH